MRTFYEFLMDQLQRRDNVGDLAREVELDPEATQVQNTFDAWSEHIAPGGSILMQALVDAWFIYDPTFIVENLEVTIEEKEEE